MKSILLTSYITLVLLVLHPFSYVVVVLANNEAISEHPPSQQQSKHPQKTQIDQQIEQQNSPSQTHKHANSKTSSSREEEDTLPVSSTRSKRESSEFLEHIPGNFITNKAAYGASDLDGDKSNLFPPAYGKHEGVYFLSNTANDNDGDWFDVREGPDDDNDFRYNSLDGMHDIDIPHHDDPYRETQDQTYSPDVNSVQYAALLDSLGVLPKDKRAREFIGKRAREFIGKRAREFIGKRAREFIGKRAREFIGKRAREFIGKRAREFIGKRAREFIGKRSKSTALEQIRNNLIELDDPVLVDGNVYDKRAREFIGKRAQEVLDKRAREFIGKRAREFIGKRAREFIGKRAREFIGKRAREFIGKRSYGADDKRAREFIGKRAREFIGKRGARIDGLDSSPDLDKRAREFIGKRAREFIGKRDFGDDVKRAREFIGKRSHSYQFADDYPQSDSEYLEPSENNFGLSTLQLDADNKPMLHSLLYPSKNIANKELMPEYSEDFSHADKRAREFIGKRLDFDDDLIAKRAREFIGKRASGDFEHLISDDRLNEAFGIQ